MSLPRRIETMIAPTVEDMGFSVVQVRLLGKEALNLQVMIDRQDGTKIVVDDCAAVSRAVSAILDVEDPISAAFTLEVSSPGVDRPLVRPADYERFAGFEVKVELDRPLDGRRRFRGKLLGIKDDMVKLDLQGETVELAYPDIRRAKLVITDELLAASEGQQEQ